MCCFPITLEVIHRGLATKQRVIRIEIQLDCAALGRFQVSQDHLTSFARGNDRAVFTGAIDGVLAARKGHATVEGDFAC